MVGLCLIKRYLQLLQGSLHLADISGQGEVKCRLVVDSEDLLLDLIELGGDGSHVLLVLGGEAFEIAPELVLKVESLASHLALVVGLLLHQSDVSSHDIETALDRSVVGL
jgi:hypothetical protein